MDKDGWRPIEEAPEMIALWLHHEYYSHGQVRLGYRSRKGEWIGVNANGTESYLVFEPTHWQSIPSGPRHDH